eukprot:scaffold5263_cov36-Attheya_sp.AAC.1
MSVLYFQSSRSFSPALIRIAFDECTLLVVTGAAAASDPGVVVVEVAKGRRVPALGVLRTAESFVVFRFCKMSKMLHENSAKRRLM